MSGCRNIRCRNVGESLSHLPRHAAEVISENPIALQLRYLQTLEGIAAENNSTIVFPVPVDVLSSLMPGWSRAGAGAGAGAGTGAGAGPGPGAGAGAGESSGTGAVGTTSPPYPDSD